MSKLDMFLALSGSRQGAIKGESDKKGCEQQIEISGWSWGMSQQINPLTNKASKASGQAITVSKDLDSSTTPIMSAVKIAEVLSAEITCRDSGGEKPIDILKVKLKNARICDYNISGRSGEGRHVQENLTIAFQDIEIIYHPKTSANQRAGACTFVDHYA